VLRVLITGINGFIGQYLAFKMPSGVELIGSVRDGSESNIPLLNSPIEIYSLNLENNIELQLDQVSVDIVIHTAAMASLNTCEKSPEKAIRINAQATEELALWCLKKNSRLIYLSTDIVFRGSSSPYSELDVPDPINVYGQTKMMGELAIQNILAEHAIIRIALSLGRGLGFRKNFIDWILEKIDGRQEIFLFSDEYRTSTAVSVLAEKIWQIVLSSKTGIFHLSGAKRINRFELGQMICNKIDKGSDLIKPISVSEMTDYPRPRDVSLKCNRTLDGGKLILPGIDKLLSEIISTAN